MRSDERLRRIGRLLFVSAGLILGGMRLWAGDPPPTNPGGGWQGPFSLSPPYGFEDALVASPAMPALFMYLATQNGSGLSLNSDGSFTYQWNPVVPRETESLLYTDIFLEYEDSGGNWDPIPWNGGMPDLVDGFPFGGNPATAISGTNGQANPGATVQWNFYRGAGSWSLPQGTSFRVFIYAYVVDQGQHPAYVNLASYSNVVTTPGSRRSRGSRPRPRALIREQSCNGRPRPPPQCPGRIDPASLRCFDKRGRIYAQCVPVGERCDLESRGGERDRKLVHNAGNGERRGNRAVLRRSDLQYGLGRGGARKLGERDDPVRTGLHAELLRRLGQWCVAVRDPGVHELGRRQ